MRCIRKVKTGFAHIVQMLKMLCKRGILEGDERDRYDVIVFYGKKKVRKKNM